jgi:non-ribosomal peptide synthetase component F
VYDIQHNLDHSGASDVLFAAVERVASFPDAASPLSISQLLQLAQFVQDNLFKIMKHAQHGMRNALAAGNLDTKDLDTMVNILVKDHDGEHVGQVFQRHGDRPTWESEFMTLEVENDDEVLVMKLSLKMEPRRVEFLLESYEKVLRAFMQNPTQTISGVNILGTKENGFLYDVISNRKTLHVPAPSLLHARFDDHTQELPDAIVIDWDATVQVSYAELNARANQVTHYLTNKGVSVRDDSPLILEKPINTTVAILGVMKAGAAYVPLSPDNPVDRNSFTIGDVKGRTVLTETDHADMFSSVPNLNIARID